MNALPSLPVALQPDLAGCDHEQIHIPGHIQPHGVLIATDPDSWRISHVSSNIEQALGIRPDAVLDCAIDRLLGPEACAALMRSLEGENYAPSNVVNLASAMRGQPDHKVLAHRHAGRIILELERGLVEEEALNGANTTSDVLLSRAHSVMESLRQAQTTQQLCDIAAREVKQLTGYDRVMVYRFDNEGHGTVVADEREPGLEPYLHLKYPASDIPAQARRLYVLQRVRSIADVNYRPAPLLTKVAGAELDMSFCALRGVSPIHLEYLRNMGVTATLTISLLNDDALWGMIVCHHGSAFAPPAEMRSLGDMIGQFLSMLLGGMSNDEQVNDRFARQQAIAALRCEMEAADSVAQALMLQGPAVLDLMGSTGALITFGGKTVLIGVTPPLLAIAAMLAQLRPPHLEEIVAISDAGRLGGVAAEHAEHASGILLMPVLGSPNDTITWFRPEMVRTVRWAGDPRHSSTRDPLTGLLSPRKSFAAWCEQLRGHAEAWTALDLQTAHDLRRTITASLLRHAEAQLAQLSAYDPLTALTNRRTLKAHVERCRIEGTCTVASMLFFDLDRFKAVNESLGHAAGDHVLIQMAERMRQLTPPQAVAGRLGGDEFVIFWPGGEQHQAEALASVLLRELAEPFLLDGQKYYANASVGVACCDGAHLDHLLREADEAMYTAKRQGGGRVVVFQAKLHASALTTMKIEQDLFRAVENDELEVYYQPIVTVIGRNVTGFEALLRWQHPQHGWVSPAIFVPRAEEAGLITRIGAWVFACAVRQIACWRRVHGDLTMSVNVSVRQLMEGSFSKFVADILATEQLEPEAVCIEVTEGALMHEAAVCELHLLRALGVKIAVDDFGTGYSSLSYLRNLPVDIVKIDRSFVVPLGSNPKAERFFAAILDLARTLELRTLAEGCETEAQWQAIQSAGCESVQGWIISKALAPEAAQALLEADAAIRRNAIVDHDPIAEHCFAKPN